MTYNAWLKQMAGVLQKNKTVFLPNTTYLRALDITADIEGKYNLSLEVKEQFHGQDFQIQPQSDGSLVGYDAPKKFSGCILQKAK